MVSIDNMNEEVAYQERKTSPYVLAFFIMKCMSHQAIVFDMRRTLAVEDNLNMFS